jgi:hypothetical protein
LGGRDHRHATDDILYGGGKPSTWLTPNGALRGQVVYDTYGLGIGFVRFPREVLGSVQITSHTPVDDEYTDYFFVMKDYAALGRWARHFYPPEPAPS